MKKENINALYLIHPMSDTHRLVFHENITLRIGDELVFEYFEDISGDKRLNAYLIRKETDGEDKRENIS